MASARSRSIRVMVPFTRSTAWISSSLADASTSTKGEPIPTTSNASPSGAGRVSSFIGERVLGGSLSPLPPADRPTTLAPSTDEDESAYRLDRRAVPSVYRLLLAPDLDTATFTGSAE